MAGFLGRAAVLAALLMPQIAAAQDVTLTALDGGLSLSGTLQTFDGEFYRVKTSYGLLTVDGQGVICEGPGCPDLVVPKAVIRMIGASDAGTALMPPLFAAFARSRGLQIEVAPGPGYAAAVRDPVSGKTLSEISFLAAGTDASRAALLAGEADLVVAMGGEPDLTSRTLAMDALVPIVAADNRLPLISSIDLAEVLSGKVKNWSEIGGPDMPLVLHALTADSDLQRALSARLGRDVVGAVAHPTLAALAEAVAKDPWAIAVTGEASVGAARRLVLTDSCGFPLQPDALAVKAEDYPLALPVYLITPRRRLPLFARDFLEFLATPTAQAAVAAAGYVNRAPEAVPMTTDGLRLINAIKGAGEEITLAELKRLVGVMDGADRLSLTFRFRDGTTELEDSSRETLTDLARLLEIGQFRDKSMILAGFSDGSGGAQANMDLSKDRAEAVLKELRDAAPDLDAAQFPRVEAFGETLPMACDTTTPGRRINRRVEVWLRPLGAGDVRDSLEP